MYLGVDIGSVSVNAVLLDRQKQVRAYVVQSSGYNHKETVSRMIHTICSQAGIAPEEIRQTVATGYGRGNVAQADESYTEITCHAVGVRLLFPRADTIIDIGGQDSKVIRLGATGAVENFVMNDKCAAGTGRYLEVMAGIMEMDLETFSCHGLSSHNPYKISSTCTVFSESEVISGIARGVPREDLIAGLNHAIVSRILGMVYSLGKGKRCVLTGGVAKNQGIAGLLHKRLQDLVIPDEPQITGALGAALMGWRRDG